MKNIKDFLNIRLTEEFKQKFKIGVNEIGRRMYDKQIPQRQFQNNRRLYRDRKGPVDKIRMRANMIAREHDNERDLDHFVYRCCIVYDTNTNIDDSHLHLDEHGDIQLKD